LIADIVTLLKEIPRDDGPFLFATISSIDRKQVPIGGFSRVKLELDVLIAADLGRPVEFRLHDIRRTVRTRLSELKVRDDVAEAVLAHVQGGIKGVCNRNQFLPEKTKALKLWHKKLKSIVEPSQPKPKPKSAI
jgi:hypothetical protein